MPYPENTPTPDDLQGLAENEGARFWLSVMNELKNRGVQDVLIAVVDGLKGFPDAITAAFPEAAVQTCIVHLVRHSLNFCAWKDRKFVAADLRRIYGAATADQAAAELDAFEEERAGKYASIAPAWRRAWSLLPKDFPPVSTVRYYFYRWRDDGLLAEINRHLVAAARLAAGRDVQPTAGVIDSQSVKTSENTSLSGYDAGKRIKGRKRHIITDTCGNLIACEVHTANIQDRDGAPGVFAKLRREAQLLESQLLVREAETAQIGQLRNQRLFRWIWSRS